MEGCFLVSDIQDHKPFHMIAVRKVFRDHRQDMVVRFNIGGKNGWLLPDLPKTDKLPQVVSLILHSALDFKDPLYKGNL